MDENKLNKLFKSNNMPWLDFGSPTIRSVLYDAAVYYWSNGDKENFQKCQDFILDANLANGKFFSKFINEEKTTKYGNKELWIREKFFNGFNFEYFDFAGIKEKVVQKDSSYDAYCLFRDMLRIKSAVLRRLYKKDLSPENKDVYKQILAIDCMDLIDIMKSEIDMLKKDQKFTGKTWFLEMAAIRNGVLSEKEYMALKEIAENFEKYEANSDLKIRKKHKLDIEKSLLDSRSMEECLHDEIDSSIETKNYTKMTNFLDNYDKKPISEEDSIKLKKAIENYRKKVIALVKPYLQQCEKSTTADNKTI